MTLSFFRRHRKWFMVLMCLAVFSIVFFQSWKYVEDAILKLTGSDPLSAKVGWIAGKPVTERQLNEFRRELLAVGDSFYFWEVKYLPDLQKRPEVAQQLFVMTQGRSAIMNLWSKFPSSRGEMPTNEDVLTWMAFYEEALKYGFTVTTPEAEQRLAIFQNMGIRPDVLYATADQAGLQRPEFTEGIRKDMAMFAYMAWLHETLYTVVEPELRIDFAKQDERIKVRLAVLRASDAVADIPAPTEEEIEKQFTTYKKYLAGDSPEGFGYRIPDKVQVEYLTADPESFLAEARTKVTETDIQRWYEYYKDTDYVASEPTGTSAAAPAEKKYKPLDQVKAEVTRKVVLQLAKEMAQENVHAAAVEVRSSPVPPTDLGMWVDPGKRRLMRLPGFLTAAELKKVKGLGQATRQSATGVQADRLVDVAFNVDALTGKDKAEGAAEKNDLKAILEKDKTKAAPKLTLNGMSDVFTDPDGVAYAFRVTAVEKNHEPKTLGEVRDKVAEDVKLIKAFDLVRDKARKLLTDAEAKGLEAAAKEANVKTFDSDYVKREERYTLRGQTFTLPTTLPEVGADKKLVEECFQMLAEKDKKKLRLITLTDKHMAVIVELLDEKAPRQALFDQDRQDLIRSVSKEVAGSSYEKALSAKEIRARMDVVVEAPPERNKADENVPVPQQPAHSSDD